MKYKLGLSFLILSGIINCLNLSSQSKDPAFNKKDFPVFEMQEFHHRGGLPNVFEKISSQRQVRIAYIGGSITAAKEGWRDMTFNWFRTTFPQTAFYQIDACIGGTGSDLGVFRLERDVLIHKPDLLFIEFAVNDNGRTREEILRSMEGIIRQTWMALPNTDICLVYTTAGPFAPDLAKGKPKHTSEAMEELADHYKIPSIHMGMEVARLYAEGKLVLQADPADNANTIVFTRDNTHPLSESGHPLYAAIVIKYLDRMQTEKSNIDHLLPKPYVPDNMVNAKMVELDKLRMEGDWQKLEESHEIMKLSWAKFTPELYKANPGSSLHFKFKGSMLGFFDAIGPDVGIIDVLVDGTKHEIIRFDAWCSGYRCHAFFIKDIKDGLHEVEVRVTDKPVDKAQILTRKKVILDQNDARYLETAWYPANIMILGDIVK